MSQKFCSLIGFLSLYLILQSCVPLPPLQNENNYKIIKCPDGSQVIIYDVEKLFPNGTTELEAITDISTKGCNKLIKAFLRSKLPDTIKASVKSRTISFREKLNQANIKLQDELKASLALYQTRCCDKDNKEILLRTLSVIEGRKGILGDINRDLENLNSKAKNDPLGAMLRMESLMKRLEVAQEKIGQIDTLNNKNPNFDELSGKLDAIHYDILKIRKKLTNYIAGELFFDSGMDSINIQAMENLRIVNITLNRNNEKEILILGHADDVPIKNAKFKDNYELSRARAISVGKFLINNYRIDPSRLNICGLSNHYPISLETTEEARQRNRRVEIYLVNSSDLEAFPIEKDAF